MKAWDLSVDTPLELVFSWCLRERAVDRLLFSMRLYRNPKGRELPETGVEEVVASIFGDKILERIKARRWPGTELIGHDGVVFRVSFDESLVKPMAELGERLSNWRHSNRPRLPEDPCLYRNGDEWPVLVSVTHERDAWIISESRPPFCLGEPFEFNPENLMVPSSAEGFVGA